MYFHYIFIYPFMHWWAASSLVPYQLLWAVKNVQVSLVCWFRTLRVNDQEFSSWVICYFYFFFLIFFIHVSVSVCHVCVGAQGGQKRALNPLELRLKLIVSHPAWMLGNKLKVLWKEQQMLLIADPYLTPHPHPTQYVCNFMCVAFVTAGKHANTRVKVRTTFGSLFSYFHCVGPEVELRLSGLAASVFTHCWRIILPALKLILLYAY